MYGILNCAICDDLSHLQIPFTSIQMRFSYSYVAIDKISTDLGRRMVTVYDSCAFLGRLLQVDLIVDLIKWISRLKFLSLRPSVCLSPKSSFDFNEIWYVGIGQWVIHDGMHYDPIQGNYLEPLKVGNSAHETVRLVTELNWIAHVDGELRLKSYVKCVK